MEDRGRTAILIGLFAVLALGAVVAGPMPQPAAYHDFADARSLWGVNNFKDVTSNLPFGLAGLWGLWTVFTLRRAGAFVDKGDDWPYIVFFTSVVLVTVGSSYYHFAPDNARLFWGRLPITVGFMALFSGFVADRAAPRRIGPWLLPVFVVAGVFALVYWIWSESQGRGDLAPYVLVQLYPIMALPLLCWLYPKARYTGGWYPLWIILWYGAAKIFEALDPEIYHLTGGMISGHSLKHLVAAGAALVVAQMLRWNRRSVTLRSSASS